jgi:hypothetical protein
MPMLTLRKPKDFIAGILFLVAGIAVVYISFDYSLGTLRRMGPGYFPVILGTLLCLFAVLIIAGSFAGEAQTIEPFTGRVLRALVLVLGGALIFGLTVRWAGLIPSIFAMAFLGSFAMPGYGLFAALVTAVILTAGSTSVFGWMLTQPIPLFAF